MTAGPWMMGVAVLEFDGKRVRREWIYVTEPWEARRGERPGG